MAKERNIVSKQTGGSDAMVVTNEGTIERFKWLLAKIQASLLCLHIYYV